MENSLYKLNTFTGNNEFIGKLNIITNNNVTLFAKTIKDLLSKYPSLNFNIQEKSTPEIFDTITSGEDALCFLAYLFEHNAKNVLNTDNYFQKTLCEHKTNILMTRSHVLGKYQRVSIKSILKYPLASYEISNDNFNFLYSFLSQYGKPNIVLKTNF